MRKLLWTLMLGIMLVPFILGSSYSAKVPVKITPLPKTAPKQIRALLGKWQGEWLGYYQKKIPAYLIVKKISIVSKKMLLTYGWQQWDGTKKSVSITGILILKNNSPKIKFGRKYGPKFTFILKKNGVLEGTRIYQSQYTVISMHKVH